MCKRGRRPLLNPDAILYTLFESLLIVLGFLINFWVNKAILTAAKAPLADEKHDQLFELELESFPVKNQLEQEEELLLLRLFAYVVLLHICFDKVFRLLFV